MDFHTIILKTTRLSFFDKAGCTRQFESELSMRSFAKSICPFRRAGCVSFCPNTIPESESSIPDLSHQAAKGGQIAVFEQGIVAGIGCLIVGLQGVEDFADFLKFLTVRRYGLEGMTGEQIDLGQL